MPVPIKNHKVIIITCAVVIALTCLGKESLAGGDSNPKHDLHSLTIAGGISLGAYEAGMNWAFVKILKESKGNNKLIGTTGASAGNVNALTTTVHWCNDKIDNELTNNLFWKMWIPLGMDTLFPGMSTQDEYKIKLKNQYQGIVLTTDAPEPSTSDGVYSAYKKDDGLFARTSTAHAIDYLVDALERKDFNDCMLTMGITLTKAQPAVVILGDQNKASKKLNTQKFVLPLVVEGMRNKLSIRMQELAHVINSSEFTATQSGMVLRLPSQREDHGEIVRRTLILAVQASAAFPVAFGPVVVPFCSNEPPDHPIIPPLYECSDGYLHEEQFIDGGTFDNIPLGLAALQAEQRYYNFGGVIDECIDRNTPDIEFAGKVNYWFIDPNRKRSEKKSLKTKVTSKQESPKSIEKFWMPYIGGFMNSSADTELINSTLNHSYLQDKIELSSRYAPIVGEYLWHFGAFFDRPLREYDYYVGVYDAIINFAYYACKKEGDVEPIAKCLDTKAHDFASKLGMIKDGKHINDDAWYVFSNLLSMELKELGLPKSEWACPLTIQDKKKTNVMIIMDTLLKIQELELEDNKDNNKDNKDAVAKADRGEIEKFENFVSQLSTGKFSGRRYLATNAVPKQDLEYEIESYFGTALFNFRKARNRFIYDAVERLAFIEREDGAKTGEEVLDFARFVVPSAFDLNQIGLNPSSLQLDPSRVPDYDFNSESWGQKISRFLPYRIGMNGSEGGGMVGYQPTWYWKPGKYKRTGLSRAEFPFEPIVGNIRKGITYSSLGAMLPCDTGSIIFPSVSIGPIWHQPWDGSAPVSTGGRISIALLDNYFSFSYSARDIRNNPWGDNYWTLSINNFNALLYWAWTIFGMGGMN